MITQLTDTNYLEILEKQFLEKKIIICLVGTPSCKECITTKDNIIEFVKQNPNHNLIFNFIDKNTYIKVLQNSQEFYKLMEYPKTIILYDDQYNKEFREGVITLNDLIKLNATNQKSFTN